MKLYLTHSTGYDYSSELYDPLKETLAKEHDIFFPHDIHLEGVKSKDIIPTCAIVLAETSYPSTGQGIELGWADASNIPIVYFYKTGFKSSGSLRFISSHSFSYDTDDDMIAKLRNEIENLKTR